MPKPGEHKTVQARILHYAQEIGWTFVPREEADRRCGVDASGRPASLYFDDLLYQTVEAFNPAYSEALGALVGAWRRSTRQ